MQSLRPQNKRASRIKKASLTVASVLLLCGAGVASLYALELGPFATQSPAVIDGGRTGGTTKSDPGSDDENPVFHPPSGDHTSDSDKNPGSDSEDVSNSDEKLLITSAHVNGSMLTIRTLINEITQDGTCSLVMTSVSGKTYTASAGVQPSASSSVCKGFDVPLSSLGSGTWKIVVTYTNNSTSASASKDIVINA